MVLAIAVIIFVIGCCLESYEDNNYRAQKRAEQRHRELMNALNEASRKNNTLPATRRKRQVRRRIAQDRNGNTLGEEIIIDYVE